jgi:pyruvate dehydrogenase complex dehydrogenase (E1) component
MAMVVRANKKHAGLGGHISTFASSATLYEVGFNHFFRAKSSEHPGDTIFPIKAASAAWRLRPLFYGLWWPFWGSAVPQ